MFGLFIEAPASILHSWEKRLAPQVFTVISPQVLDIEHWRNFIFVWQLQLVGILSNFLYNLERAIYPWLELSKLSWWKPIFAKVYLNQFANLKLNILTTSICLFHIFGILLLNLQANFFMQLLDLFGSNFSISTKLLNSQLWW